MEKNWQGIAVDSCSFVDGTVVYTGCTEDILGLMVDVPNTPLIERQTFTDKETLLMRRIVEEANLYGVWIKIVCSDGFQVDVRGDQ